MRRCVLVTLRAAGHGDVGLVAAEDKDAETDERKPSKAFGLTLQHTHKKCTDSPSAPILVPRCPPSRACLSSSLSRFLPQTTAGVTQEEEGFPLRPSERRQVASTWVPQLHLTTLNCVSLKARS